jgi:hypothetical protein
MRGFALHESSSSVCRASLLKKEISVFYVILIDKIFQSVYNAYGSLKTDGRTTTFAAGPDVAGEGRSGPGGERGLIAG